MGSLIVTLLQGWVFAVAKVFLPGQWKKLVKTGNNRQYWQKVST